MGNKWTPQKALSKFSILAIGEEEGIGFRLAKKREVNSYFDALPKGRNDQFGIQYFNSATENVDEDWGEKRKRYLGWMRLEIDDLRKFSAELDSVKVMTVLELFQKAKWSEEVDREDYYKAIFTQKHKKYAVLMQELCQIDISLPKPKHVQDEPDGTFSIRVHNDLVDKYYKNFERAVCKPKWRPDEIELGLMDCLMGAYEDLSKGKKPFVLSAEFGSHERAERIKRDITLFSKGTLNPAVDGSRIKFSGYDVPKIKTLFPEMKFTKELPEQPPIKLLSDFGLNLQMLRDLGIKTHRNRQ